MEHILTLTLSSDLREIPFSVSRSDKDHREVERQTKLEEAVLETDIPTLSLEADGEIEMQEADLKTDGTSQSQKVEGEIELDDAVAIPSQSQEV